MNAMTRILVTGLALGTTAVATAGILPDIKVAYSKQELASPALAAGLYGRVTNAVHQSCAQLNGAELARKRNYQNCVTTLLAKAIHDVHSPALAAVHEARTGEHIEVMQMAVRLADETPTAGTFTR